MFIIVLYCSLARIQLIRVITALLSGQLVSQSVESAVVSTTNESEVLCLSTRKLLSCYVIRIIADRTGACVVCSLQQGPWAHSEGIQGSANLLNLVPTAVVSYCGVQPYLGM